MNLQIGVKVLIQNDAGQYLFIQRAVKMEGEKQPHWDIPGGRINAGEPLMDALAREVKEETGLGLLELPKLIAAQDIFVTTKDVHVVRLTYTVKGNGDVALSDEHEKHAWWTKEEAAVNNNLDPYTKELL